MPRLETLDDVKMWIAEHDGRITAWWDQQHKWNGNMDLKCEAMNKRLTAVEKRVIFFSGFAAAVGALIGNLF